MTKDLYPKSAIALRRIRSTIFDYDNTPKEAQAARVLTYLKKRMMRDIPSPAYKHSAYAEVMWM